MDTVQVSAQNDDCNVLIFFINKIDTQKTSLLHYDQRLLFTVDAPHDRSVRVPDHPEVAGAVP